MPKTKTKAKKPKTGKGPLLDKTKDAIGSVISKAIKAYFARSKGKGRK